MDQTTRKFLALLGNDSCGAICERLTTRESTQSDLVEELELQSRDVGTVLEELLLVGLVRWRKEPTEGPGRPAKVWRLARADELVALEDHVREMRKRLLEADGN